MIKCKYCESTDLRIKDKNIGRYLCKTCKKTFTYKGEVDEPSKKIGMSLNEFTRKFDKEYILTTTLKRVMSGLKRDTIYERTDVIKLTGLGNSFPGLSPALEAYDEYYGKTNQKVFYSHPDTIAELKRTAKLS